MRERAEKRVVTRPTNRPTDRPRSVLLFPSLHWHHRRTMEEGHGSSSSSSAKAAARDRAGLGFRSSLPLVAAAAASTYVEGMYLRERAKSIFYLSFPFF